MRKNMFNNRILRSFNSACERDVFYVGVLTKPIRLRIAMTLCKKEEDDETGDDDDSNSQ
ncbi:unnamed protein product [Mucor hiemalis]